MRNLRNYRRYIGLLLVVVCLLFTLTACGSSAAPEDTPAQGTDSQPTTEVVENSPTEVPANDDAVEPTQEPIAESAGEPAAEQPVSVETNGKVCFGSYDYGVACLEGGSWSYYDENAGMLSDTVSDMAQCADGKLLASSMMGLSSFDGNTWSTVAGDWMTISPESVACDANGGIWITYYTGASYFDGTTWTNYPATDLSSGDSTNDLVDNVAVAPDGTVWVQTAYSIAAFKDGAWTVYQFGNGFDDIMYFDGLVVDAQGQPWTTTMDSLVTFDGSAWVTYPINDYLTVESLAADKQGRILVGTYDQGLYVFENGNWSIYSQETGDLSSNHVRSVAVDDAGRIWAGTTYGVNVFDGAAWTVYRMDNSDIHDNDIYAISVTGGGPALPAETNNGTGTITGTLLDKNGAPLVNVMVEVCVEDTYFYDSTPCTGQPFMQQTTSVEDGSFTLADLPVGMYVVTVNLGDSWAVLTDDYGIGSQRVTVNADQIKDLGTLQESED